MSAPFSELPGILAVGIHELTLDRLIAIGVTNFPLSQRRAPIMEGFRQIFQMLREQGITGDVIVDGSFLTEEIDPKDIDFSLCVSPEFYENSSASQRKLMDWIGDDQTIKNNYLCDCYLCVEYPQGHEQYFDGIQNRLYWTNLYRFSAILKRERGIGVIHL
jgi:hypothetical protein